jgi:hypothetical protein
MWCLCNIASGFKGLVWGLIDNMALPTLKTLLFAQDTSQQVLELVIWCYGNIAGETAEVRDDNVLGQGVVGPIIEALRKSENGSSFMRNTTWCLASFLKGNPPPHIKHSGPIVKALVDTLLVTDTELILSDILGGLSIFS